jgi:tRNA (guanine-N7-)-methyltransferase
VSVRRSQRLSLEELAPFLLAVPDPPRPLAWPEVFGTDRPVEIEVGFGKGLFLLTASEACPEVNFLGIEIARKYQLFTAARIAKRGRANVRLACTDARALLRTCVQPGSVHAVHTYFPDPWWKKRHVKRRLYTPEFATACEAVLCPGGLLHVVTDVEEYFHIIAALLTETTKLARLPAPNPKDPRHDLDYLTNFERKFRKEGRPIYRAEYAKLS